MIALQQFLIYQSEDGSTRINVMLEAETLWLNQKQLTELCGKAKGTISEHIKHVFEDGELDENSVVRFFRTTAADGKQYEVAHYNLDMVLAPGLPGAQSGGCALSPVGQRQAEGIYRQGLRAGRRALEEPRPGSGLFRRVDPQPARHPHQRAALLPKDHGYLRHQCRLHRLHPHPGSPASDERRSGIRVSR